MSALDSDALVIGGGPAGAAASIWLARSGWRVVLVEQATFPRQKVCGECLNPASLQLLEALGVGGAVRAGAGPELRQVAWMSGTRTVYAAMPECRSGPHRFGRAIGRDRLDAVLLERARTLGVTIIQPARVTRVAGAPGAFDCSCELRPEHPAHGSSPGRELSVTAALVIDAHGSWERAPLWPMTDVPRDDAAPNRPSDLLAFKATFQGARLPSGVLPVLALPGGYGGIVQSNDGRTTLACCIRRDVLRQRRTLAPGMAAGSVVEAYLLESCQALRRALECARREGPWKAAGPLRPGFRAAGPEQVVRIGNAAVEAHPLVGEGICMALQSAARLAQSLPQRPGDLGPECTAGLRQLHARACRAEFARRVRLARLYSAIAMRPWLAGPAGALMQPWPRLLTLAAQMAGKGRGLESCPET